MDDNGPKPSVAPQTNIDDLVKQLSRPQGASPIPSAPSAQSVRPPVPASVSVSPRPMALPTLPPTSLVPQSRGSAAPQPSPSGTGGVGTPPATSTPIAPSTPKEYQSSIRTMQDDLSKLKVGQQPQGVNIPRKVEAVPVPKTPTPVPTAPQAPNKSLASATLPSSIKSSELPSSSAPQLAPKPPVAGVIPPQRPTITIPAPIKSPELRPDQKNQFVVPGDAPSDSGGSKRGLLLGGIVLLLALAGGLYWFFMIRTVPAPQVVESPTPVFTPRPTATPNLDPLASVFPTRGTAIILPAVGSPASAFANGLAQQNPESGAFVTTQVQTIVSSSSTQTYNIPGLFDRFSLAYPPELKAAFGQQFRILAYEQKEAFDSKGRPLVNAPLSNRLVLVSEIAPVSETILQNWELSMPSDLGALFGITPAKGTNGYLGTTYRGSTIRYKNFPYPDRSIDYGLVPHDGKTYLIIAGSREAMFAAIDAFQIPGK